MIQPQTTNDGRKRPVKATNSRTTRPRASYADGWTQHIPAALRARPQWVVWRYEWRADRNGGGKWTKVPYQPRWPNTKAKANDPATCGTFAEALAAYQAHAKRTDTKRLDGIGYQFHPDDGFAGIDLDNCLTPDGTLAEWADEWLRRLGPTYAEVSPSGHGIKAFYQGSLPAKPNGTTGRRRGGYGADGSGEIEVYDRTRYFTLTGARWPDAPDTINTPDDGALATLAAALDDGCQTSHRKREGRAGASHGASEHQATFDTSDDALLNRARNARNGAKFRALYDAGDCSGYKSGSEADFALLVMLAYWTGEDPARMERLFDTSALAHRAKWADRPDYRVRSISEAIARNKGAAPSSRGHYRPTEGIRATANGRNHDGTDNGHHPTLDKHLSRWPCTDLGNAERLVARHGHDLHYCHPWKCWLVWDGRRWRRDDTGEVRRRGRRTVRAILAEAATEPDDARRKELVSWALASEKRDRIGALLHLAEAEEGIPILPDQLDVDPWSFNVLNGTINLRTGELRPHDRGDLITKLCPLDYYSDAPCPLWRATLDKFFDRPDSTRKAALIDYFQRLCGYALAGVIRDHVMPVAYGNGGNGKSTILGALLDVFGPDYAMKAPPDMFMAKKTDSHPTDRADLFGKRLVVAIETEAGRRLNETMVKELTGGDPIRARRMHENFWEFKPTHTLFMATNHKPRVRGTDNGIWRRLKLVPFTVNVNDAEADKAMPEKLQAEAVGILAWFVQGCLKWQKQGLGAPDEVTEATADYRAEQDLIGIFLDHCVTRGSGLKVKASALYERYKKWAEAGNEHVMTLTNFGTAIRERGIESKSSNGVWYLGIG